VLTGHTLMVGDVGRTKLAEDAASGARTLFGSLQRLKALPDHIEVLPGAYSGSVCGRRLSGKPSSTIGFERRHNTAFRTDAEADFVDFMLQDIRPRRRERQRYGPGIPEFGPLRLNDQPWLTPRTPQRQRGPASHSGCARTGSSSRCWCSSTPSSAGWSAWNERWCR